MVAELTILGIAGSLRTASFNRGLLRAAQEGAPQDVSIEIYENLGQIPLYNQDVENRGDPPAVAELKEMIRAADALLIATPEYNYGVPGVLKNAVDWAARPPATTPLRHKPIAIMGASGGNFGTVRAQLSLRQTFLFIRSHVLIEPEVLVARARERFDESCTLKDEQTMDRVCQLDAALVGCTRQHREVWAAPRLAEARKLLPGVARGEDAGTEDRYAAAAGRR